MVKYVNQPLKFFNEFNEESANKICEYCKNEGVSIVIIENIAEEFKTKCSGGDNYFLGSMIKNVENKYEDLINKLETNIEMYKQFFENHGLSVICFTPKVPRPGEQLIEKYGLPITVALSFLNGVIMLLYIPIDCLLRKLGKVEIADKISSALVLPPLKEQLERKDTLLLRDIKKFAEKLQKDGRRVVCILLNREAV